MRRATWSCVGTLAVTALACATPIDPLALHHDAIVVDGHADTTPRFEDPSWDFAQRHKEGHVDLPRIREGGLDVQFWSIYMGEREGDGRAIREALERIDAVHAMAARHPEDVVVAGSVAEVRRHVAEGKLVSLMGVEGGHIIEDNLAVLRTFHRLGVRYMTLTHSFHTAWADSSGTREPLEPEHGGLTTFGEEVVREMNRLGMIVDISHVSDDTVRDVLRVSEAPVIASHSSCRAIANHVRNLSDALLGAIAENGGVVMINFFPGYLDEATAAEGTLWYERHAERLAELRALAAQDPDAARQGYRALFAADPFPRTSLSTLLDHFDHAIRVAGPDHVGLGSDFDGVASMPEELDDVSRLPLLTAGLLERGHSPETVRNVLGENLLRLMEEVEAVATD